MTVTKSEQLLRLVERSVRRAYLNCSCHPLQGTVTHSRAQNANAVQFTWTSPVIAGDVEF